MAKSTLLSNPTAELFKPYFQARIKVIHPKCYKQLKEAAQHKYLADRKWAGFGKISLFAQRSRSRIQLLFNSRFPTFCNLVTKICIDIIFSTRISLF